MSEPPAPKPFRRGRQPEQPLAHELPAPPPHLNGLRRTAWYRLDQDFNSMGSAAWRRIAVAQVFCADCRRQNGTGTLVATLLDLDEARVLGLLNTDGLYDQWLWISPPPKNGPAETTALWQACGTQPDAATCPVHGLRPMTHNKIGEVQQHSLKWPGPRRPAKVPKIQL